MDVDLERLYIPEPNSGCWLWEGDLDSGGYGALGFLQAHRLFYFLLNHILSNRKQVLDHKCRVRSCVNPNHLELVTQRENIQRGNTGIINRTKTHCKNGHEYNELNTRWKNGRRHRVCKACYHASWKNWYNNRGGREYYKIKREASLIEGQLYGSFSS